MKRNKFSALIVGIAVLTLAGPQLLSAQPAETTAAKNTAIIPMPRDEKWVGRHDGFVTIAKQGDFDLLFVGDSITDGWRGSGKTVWGKYFAPMKAANFGIGGDQTQHVLWRLDNGELEGAHPKLAVLMIGTNNLRNNSNEEIAEGIAVIVKDIRTKCPATKVLLLAVFPRAEKAEAPERAKIKAINDIIAKLDDGKMVKYLDISAKFLDADGTLPKAIMPDSLHPNEAGYQIWADAVLPTVQQMMK
ncbi:MAG: hypothetical protein JWR19_346 [Pedosphaera sp.]|nr:hypothetical protein [Pedosphaera sp.]